MDWIPVEERLPEEGAFRCVVALRSRKPKCRGLGLEAICNVFYLLNNLEEFTHWLPLPDPPQQFADKRHEALQKARDTIQVHVPYKQYGAERKKELIAHLDTVLESWLPQSVDKKDEALRAARLSLSMPTYPFWDFKETISQIDAALEP